MANGIIFTDMFREMSPYPAICNFSFSFLLYFQYKIDIKQFYRFAWILDAVCFNKP